MKPVFAIMVTYRRFDKFKETFDSLLPTLPEGSILLIVDNHSGQGEYERWWIDLWEHRADIKHPGIKIEFMQRDKNDGWGAAMNDGLTKYPVWKEFEYILETNNDVIYESDWFEKATLLMRTYEKIGILGLWSHPHHGVRSEMWDGLVIKDNMPATSWLFRSRDLQELLPFKERGACKTRGGNGEDTDMVLKVQEKGMWVCGLKKDLAHHIDGYDIPDLGKINPAYE